MKEIFVASSSEASAIAEAVAGFLNSLPGVRARPWYEVFKPGLLTYEVIEQEARRVAGAVFLATPDDNSHIRKRRVKVPRTNVMLELGYFSAILQRSSIALCKYDGVVLPTDLQGFTYVPMGAYAAPNPTILSRETKDTLAAWATSRAETAEGVLHTQTLHGYCGRWNLSEKFTRWRERDLSPPDYVTFHGCLDLFVEQDGRTGYGFVHGRMAIRVGSYRADVKITDTVEDVQCHVDGSVSLTSKGFGRERVDHFGCTLRDTLGIDDAIHDPGPCRWRLAPSPGQSATLTGSNELSAGDYICDRAEITATRHR
jgi:hypothetical protein